MIKTWESNSRNNYIDIHCHILPEIDDGSRDMDESVEMLKSAADNGISAIVATPHVRKKDFDFGYAHEQYEKLKEYAKRLNIELKMGFEVNCEALIEFGFDCLDVMTFERSDSFLLEFHNFSLPPNWQLIVKKIIAQGKSLIIAHPERYDFIQRDIGIAEKMVNLGCQLQCDSFTFDLNRFDKQRRTVFRLLDEGLISWVATDAHSPEHYDGYFEIMDDFKDSFIGRSINFAED